MRADGYLGPPTVSRLTRRVGRYVDDAPSGAVVRAAYAALFLGLVGGLLMATAVLSVPVLPR